MASDANIQELASGKKWKLKRKIWGFTDGSIYSMTGSAPAPSKSYVQVFITETEIIFRCWKILPPTRADANQAPTENRCPYSEFAEDEAIRGDIERVLGPGELTYIDNLIHGKIDYLNRLERDILFNIIFHLDLVSISRLSQVNRLFRDLCTCDDLWSKMFMLHSSQKAITEELLLLVNQKGWKEVFFMNKLQLQMHMRRQTIVKEGSREFFLTSEGGDENVIAENEDENEEESEDKD